ncbi:MAG: hypothetical protein ACQEXX_01520 [Bacillota bacterium]
MSYQTECVEVFNEYINEQNWDTFTKEVATQVFKSGFEFGSMNGATHSIQQYAIDTIKPVKSKKAREIIEKIRFSKNN